MEFVLHFVSISGKKNSKIFRNINDVLSYIDKYEIDTIEVKGQDFTETYTSDEFEEIYVK